MTLNYRTEKTLTLHDNILDASLDEVETIINDHAPGHVAYRHGDVLHISKVWNDDAAGLILRNVSITRRVFDNEDRLQNIRWAKASIAKLEDYIRTQEIYYN